ncbi:MAG: hypothetical protein R3F20_16860 [Planctomycetota bacterium]
MKTLSALMLAVLMTASLAVAQDAEAGAKAPAEKQDAAEKKDAALEKWLDTLAANAAGKHEKIRASAFEAMVSIGAPSVARLEKLAKSEDAEVKKAAERALTQTKNRIQRERAADPKLLSADLAKEYKLDDKKAQKLEKILGDYMAKSKEMREKMADENADRRELFGEMREMNEDFQDDLSAVLTEEQIRETQRRVMQGMGGLGGGGRGGFGGRGGRGGGRGGRGGGGGGQGGGQDF